MKARGMRAKRVLSGIRVPVLCLFLLLSAFVSPAQPAPLAEREILPNGMTLLHAEKKAVPVIKIVVAIRAGSIAETADRAGLANLAADLLNEGTAKRSSKEISEAIEFVGGALTTSGGTDYITATLSVLKKDIDLGFDLLSDIILRPAFREDEITRRKALIKSSIKQQNEDPGTVASKAFSKAVFGAHPYGWPVDGTEESIDRITRQEILDFYNHWYVPNNSVMAVVGDITKGELKALLEKYFRDWKSGDIRPPLLPELLPGNAPTVVKINKDIKQTSIVLGHLGMRRDNPDYYAVSVMNYILGGGGFASRLVDNIRDNRGLAYSVHSSFMAHRHGGVFQAGLQTKNESANTAIREILNEMARIQSDPVSDTELSDAKSYLTGSFPLRMDSNSKIANLLIAIELNDLGLDYVDRYRDIINGITKEEITRVARKYLNARDYVLVVVGDMGRAALQY
ncbi:MAG: insulinase family protein [Nitrospirae bacterium]|nr:insulinase family protein [Nitrospirota bacterium]